MSRQAAGDPPTGIVVLLGPTGAGKTASALALAEARPVTVVNFDSRQVYEDFPIVTAQPDEGERAVCPHELYGFLPTNEAMDAAAFTRLACAEIVRAEAAGRLPVLVGGTGLYLRALLEGLAPIPEVPPEVREAVLTRIADEGPQALHRELQGIDPEYAARIHPNDTQRNARAREVYEATGRPLSWWHGQGEPLMDLNAVLLGVGLGLDELYPILERRIEAMLLAGAVAEVARAWERCPDPDAPGFSGIGCAELLEHVRGKTDLDDARRRWLANTRAYAKRQGTWFRKQDGIVWFRPDERDALVAEALRRVG